MCDMEKLYCCCCCSYCLSSHLETDFQTFGAAHTVNTSIQGKNGMRKLAESEKQQHTQLPFGYTVLRFQVSLFFMFLLASKFWHTLWNEKLYFDIFRMNFYAERSICHECSNFVIMFMQYGLGSIQFICLVNSQCAFCWFWYGFKFHKKKYPHTVNTQREK